MVHSKDDIQWFESLEEAKQEGYFPVKCTTPLQFYILKGRTTTLSKDNLEINKYLQYATYTSAENRYYFRIARPYPLSVFYFYEKSEIFSGEDEAIRGLRSRIEDGNVWLFFSKQQVADTSEMLVRLYKSQFKGEGKVPYLIYIQLLQQSIDYEKYKDVGKNLTGFKTVCKGYEDRIAELWNQAYKQER